MHKDILDSIIHRANDILGGNVGERLASDTTEKALSLADSGIHNGMFQMHQALKMNFPSMPFPDPSSFIMVPSGFEPIDFFSGKGRVASRISEKVQNDYLAYGDKDTLAMGKTRLDKFFNYHPDMNAVLERSTILKTVGELLGYGSIMGNGVKSLYFRHGLEGEDAAKGWLHCDRNSFNKIIENIPWSHGADGLLQVFDTFKDMLARGIIHCDNNQKHIVVDFLLETDDKIPLPCIAIIHQNNFDGLVYHPTEERWFNLQNGIYRLPGAREAIDDAVLYVMAWDGYQITTGEGYDAVAMEGLRKRITNHVIRLQAHPDKDAVFKEINDKEIYEFHCSQAAYLPEPTVRVKVQLSETKRVFHLISPHNGNVELKDSYDYHYFPHMREMESLINGHRGPLETYYTDMFCELIVTKLRVLEDLLAAVEIPEPVVEEPGVVESDTTPQTTVTEGQ